MAAGSDGLTPSDAVAQTRASPILVIRDPANGYSRTAPDLPPGEYPQSAGVPPTNGIGGATVPGIAGGATQVHGGVAQSSSDAWALRKTQDIYMNGRNYMEANITLGWERNLYHFRGEHGPKTPYARRDWRRARTFRPKTRANVKASEAAHASAAFSTQSFLDCQAYDQTNIQQVVSAHINQSLVQNRLETAPWKWFITSQGAFQDTKVYGLCISFQYWMHRQIEEVVPAYDDNGTPIMGKNERNENVPMGHKRKRVVADFPVVDLCDPALFIFDPVCDWRNPAQTSKYLQYAMPISIGDALERMKMRDPKTGQPVWREYSIQALMSTKNENIDSRTRRAREGHHRIDPTIDSAAPEFKTIWAHLNIVQEDGVDLAWWTAGTQLVLTDPVPLRQMFPHLAPGERPFVVGFSVIESHRNYPDGDVAQIAPLQEEINQIANQRLDNVRLALNKRYFIRRGSQMDLDALMRNIPGGGVMTNDPEKDVQVINTPDVTSSSYQEQSVLTQDLDELVGGFGAQAAQQAGKMVDRSGSLDQIAGAAGAVQDYGIKIFFDTWMEPVLRQIVKLEQMYETDQVLLATAAKQSPLWIRYGKDLVTDELLQQELIVRVNVGMGNTDPVKRIQKLVFGIGQINQLPQMAQRLKSDEVADEIMGSLGYKDASRFYMNDQEFKTHMQTNPPQIPPEIQLKTRELDIKEKENQARDKRETDSNSNTHNYQMGMLEHEREKLEHNTGIQAGKNRTVRDVAAGKEFNRMAEVNLKRADGARPKPVAPKPPPGKGKGGDGPPRSLQ